ncbi:MAG: hypothetical protein ACK4PM_14295 [Acinetobacter junii]
MWILVLTVIIGLLIIFFTRKIQNTETLSTSISENDSFIDNVLYTFEITEVESFQENLQKIVDSETHEKLVEVTARIISEPSNKLDKHAIKVEVKGMAVGYLHRNDAHQLKGILIDHKVAAAINVGGDSFYNVKLALQNVFDLKEI